MTDKVQKIKDFLVGMAGAACCDAKTKKNIETIILPFIDSLQEEPVSEELKEIAWNYADKRCHLDVAVFTPDEVKKERGKMQFTWQDLYDAVMFGAKWQKEKEYTCYEEAFEDEAKWKKEIDVFFNDWGKDMINGGQYGINLDIRECKDIAKHFFELGLKARL